MLEVQNRTFKFHFITPKKRMNPTETAIVLVFAGLATAIALGLLEVPPAILHSSIAQTFLLVMALVLFAYSPAVGIAAIALFAIVMFKRNVQKTAQYVAAQDAAAANLNAAANQLYSEAAARRDAREEATDMNYITREPRQYTVYNITNQYPAAASNTASPPTAVTQSAEPSVADGFASPDQVGTYNLGEPRPMASGTKSFTAMYRPSEDMGENTFTRVGPNIDAKMQSFAY